MKSFNQVSRREFLSESVRLVTAGLAASCACASPTLAKSPMAQASAGSELKIANQKLGC